MSPEQFVGGLFTLCEVPPPCFGFGLGPLGAGRFGVFLFCQDGADEEEFWHEGESWVCFFLG